MCSLPGKEEVLIYEWNAQPMLQRQLGCLWGKVPAGSQRRMSLAKGGSCREEKNSGNGKSGESG